MKISKLIKTAVLSAFAVLVVTASAGAVVACLDSDKYPNLKTQSTSTATAPNDYPIKCTYTIEEKAGGASSSYYYVYAKHQGDCSQAGVVISNPDICSGDELSDIIKKIVNAVIFIIGIVAVVMIILGGVNYATSQGDPQKVKKGKDTILYGIIGLVIAILAYAIVNFVIGALAG